VLEQEVSLNIKTTVLGYPSRDEYQKNLPGLKLVSCIRQGFFVGRILTILILIVKKNVQGAGADLHKTSPFVIEGCADQKSFVGGATEFIALIRKVSYCWLFLMIHSSDAYKNVHVNSQEYPSLTVQC
jgi:hypothetical protein